MQKAIAYEIVNHGPDHAQYFPGCGTTFTDFDECATGTGVNAKEAYEDAVESLYQSDTNPASLDKILPKRPKGIRKSDRLTAEELKNDEIYWYVSIRIKLKG